MSKATILLLLVHLSSGAIAAAEESLTPVGYRIEVQTVMEHDNGKFLWFHPRVTPMPGFAPDGSTAVLMTLMQHLHVSDYYSGTYVMRTNDLGRSWSKPVAPAELAWLQQSDDVTIGVADITPGWHAPTQKVLAVGAQVRYSNKGEQLDDRPRAHQTAYAVFDPKINIWSKWQTLEMPADEKFEYAYSACAQWLVQPDGTVLLPFYFGKNVGNSGPHSVTVVQCAFDGDALKYLRHGTEFTMPTERGLCEPSLVRFGKRYYLTIRHDLRGYVTAGNNGLTFAPLKIWTFDDGTDLGSYNTQHLRADTRGHSRPFTDHVQL